MAGRRAYQITESERDKKKAANKRRKNREKITDITVAAKKEGMTYGQYVAKYGL